MGNLIDEKALIDDLRTEARAGEAFHRIFSIYYPRLHNFAMRFMPDPADAEDIVQDVFGKLWKRRASLSYISLSSLLMTMTRNGCLNFLRHRVFIDEYSSRMKSLYAEGERLYYADMLGRADGPLLLDELRERINKVIGDLPPRTQEVFRMSRDEGLKNREIAEKLGISVKVVEKHISRALAALRSALGDVSVAEMLALLLLLE